VSLAAVTEQKTKMATAVILATLAAFLLVAASYVLFPEQAPPQTTSDGMPIPMPTSKPESPTEQIFQAIAWIGLAAGVATAVVAATLLINRKAKTDRNRELPAKAFTLFCRG